MIKTSRRHRVHLPASADSASKRSHGQSSRKSPSSSTAPDASTTRLSLNKGTDKDSGKGQLVAAAAAAGTGIEGQAERSQQRATPKSSNNSSNEASEVLGQGQSDVHSDSPPAPPPASSFSAPTKTRKPSGFLSRAGQASAPGIVLFFASLAYGLFFTSNVF